MSVDTVRAQFIAPLLQFIVSLAVIDPQHVL